jgi:hypothetical protein
MLTTIKKDNVWSSFRAIIGNTHHSILPTYPLGTTPRSLPRRFLCCKPSSEPPRHIWRNCDIHSLGHIRLADGRVKRGEREPGAEIVLFLLGEDAARKTGEVASWAGDEAGYTRQVDDVGADIEGKRERDGVRFHGDLGVVVDKD